MTGINTTTAFALPWQRSTFITARPTRHITNSTTPFTTRPSRLCTTAATSVPSKPPSKADPRPPSLPSSQPPTLSRRAFLALSAFAAHTTLKNQNAVPLRGAPAARAENFSGLLTAYKDLPKGFTILRPNGWNEFEALQGNYDIKWQDVIQPLEFVTVLTTPVAKEKRLVDIGTVQTVGGKLASSRGGQLLSAVEKDVDGVPAYVFEIEKDQARQITLLTVNKMKLYSVNASCSNRRWSKREKLLRAVVDSFKPKL